MDVSIIMVNYNTSFYLNDVVKSIKENTDGISYEIIVVDNSNNEKEYNELKKNEDVIVIDAKENLGFGKANNLGVHFSSGKYLFFLNMDTLIIDNSIFFLYDFIKNNDNVGIVSPNLYTKEMKPNHSFFKIEKNLKNEKKHYSFFNILKRRFFKNKIEFNFSKKPLKIDGYSCGAALMIKREYFDQIGGFDKDIFMYAEESLLCYKLIHDINKKIYNIPNAKIIHFEGGSFLNSNMNRVKMMVEGNSIYYEKCFGKKILISFLKFSYKMYKRKSFYSKFIHRNNKDIYEMYYKVYYSKFLEVIGC